MAEIKQMTTTTKISTLVWYFYGGFHCQFGKHSASSSGRLFVQKIFNNFDNNSIYINSVKCERHDTQISISTWCEYYVWYHRVQLKPEIEPFKYFLHYCDRSYSGLMNEKVNARSAYNIFHRIRKSIRATQSLCNQTADGVRLLWFYTQS